MAVDTDVLVVGAGPTGLMLANQLVRRGARVMIIDRHAGPALQTRALGVQARTLEIYAQLGIVDEALALGKRATGANLWARGRRTARIPFGDIGQGLSAYPFLLILGQDDNERLLGASLRERGVTVHWNTELVGVAQDDCEVRATLRRADGTSDTVSVAWVGGCDGAHSAVRELNGIEFEGAPYEHVFFVADTQATGMMVPEEVNVFLWREGFHLFFPMRGSDHWRVVGILPPALRGRNDLRFEDIAPEVRREAGSHLRFGACSWFSTYRIHHRRAATFRAGRCFILGDAAHVHSPVGAQGMNTGLQDAYNLGWKLALVVSGRADASLLETFSDERMPVAKRLLSSTDRAFSLVVSDSWFAGILRTQILARVAAFAISQKSLRRFAFRTISQIGIAYRDSALSETLPGLSDDAPRAGDRFPWLQLRLQSDGPVEDLYARLGDTRFNLLLFGQTATTPLATELGDLLRVHEIPADSANAAELARAGIPHVSFWLLRPDGHIGLAGVRADSAAVTQYLAARLHLRASVA